MNNTHFFIYGILTGTVVALAFALMMDSVDQTQVKAQGSASMSDNVAVATGLSGSNDSMLWIVTEHPDNGTLQLLAYHTNQRSPRLIKSRNIEWDARIHNLVFPRGNPDESMTPQPTPEQIEQRMQNNEEEGG